MFKAIENLQSKPETTRKKVVFFSSLVITLIILVVWISTLSLRTSQSRRSVVEESNISPIASFWNGISGAALGLVGGLGVDEYVASPQQEK